MMDKHHHVLLFCLMLLSPLLVKAQPIGRASLSQAGFISEDYRLTDKKDFQFFGVGVDTLQSSKLEFRSSPQESDIADALQGQAQGMVSPGVSVLSYINVSQLYWKQSSLSLGRKKQMWSFLDEDFLLGLYQPLFKWNTLQPESQGLTGLFIHLESPDEGLKYGFSVFGSSLFIPDQGPGYEIKDGQFERSNPYFQNVPTKAQINGETIDVNYRIIKPETQEIINHRSFAGRAFLGQAKEGFFAQVGYANKPMNQLAMGFDGYVFSNGVEDATKIEILPTVSYHTLSSADLRYGNELFGLGLSAVQETPEEPKFDGEWTYVVYKPSTVVSPFVETKYKGFLAKLSALSVEGGEAEAKGKFAAQSDKFLPQRYPFRNASQLALSYRQRLKRFQAISLGTQYLTGAQSEFALWTSKLSYQWEERWSAFAVSQLVDVQDSEAGRKTAYWPYVNNDAMAVGVNYVF